MFILISEKTLGQTCNGALGDPVVDYNFGSGSSLYGPPSTFTTYGYTAGQPNDGSYTILKNTLDLNHVRQGNWLPVTNHSNDPNGYMMLINADDQQAGIFYEQTITGLCPGTTYEFGAWIINLMTRAAIRPNVGFSIESTSGATILNFETGEILEGTKDDWKQYAGTFTTSPGVSEVVVKIYNKGVGGGGNDFCLDDITFRACGPVILQNIDGSNSPQGYVCVGQAKDIVLSADVTDGVYDNPEYLWQETGASGDWQDMPNERNKQLTKKFTSNALPGDYKYRLLVSELGNINSPNCRSASPEFTITVSPLPVPVASAPSLVCIGETINLNVNDAVSYSWSGPNGFASTAQSPVISNASHAMSGTYTVAVTNIAGCVETAQTTVTVLDRPVAAIDLAGPICKGSSINLNASGGLTYRWLPSPSLSATDIANPIASPTETTTYTVFASNGTCETPASVTVSVWDDPVADAGKDRKMISGNTIELEGKTSGDNVRYFWSPADGLDDPNKLNPKASPTSDAIYYLNAVSTTGCTLAVDAVFIKVYEKLVVPSAFSPNGDGNNDVWNITAIDVFSAPKVKVVNRYGEIVFESTGYEKAWDGKYKNQDVPAGVYYYLINLAPGMATLSGSVVVVR